MAKSQFDELVDALDAELEDMNDTIAAKSRIGLLGLIVALVSLILSIGMVVFGLQMNGRVNDAVAEAKQYASQMQETINATEKALDQKIDEKIASATESTQSSSSSSSAAKDDDKSASSSSASASAASDDKVVSSSDTTQTSAGRYSISSEKLVENDKTYHVTGVFENISDGEYASVTLTYNLLNDKDEKIGTAVASTTKLAAGAQWTFDAIGSAEGAIKFELASVEAK